MISDPVRWLLPRPKEATLLEGSFHLPDQLTLSTGGASDATFQRLIVELAPHGVFPRWVDGSAADIRLVDRGSDPASESYRLEIGERGIFVESAGPAGLFHGVSTLVQWLRAHLKGGRRKIPALRVVDAPDFAHRGVMLDISRDKVPKLETLYRLIDMLAGWKINQLQLYMEHTFAYPQHEAVWRNASPLTARDVRELDAYCRERYIELVPNQNSFGHFHRWLVHEPYRQLAECPDGIEHPFSFEREPFSLCATDPRSLEFLADLYDELLPCFGSSQFNVGLDETFDLGDCRSADACLERGKGRVYLDFLRGVHRLVSKRGKRMMFWGDVILNHPELLDRLPRDAIALEWGYEADHPFADDAKRFAESGLDYYVCPGTSSWNSFAGRVSNAIANLASAAVQGKAHGALGYLVTDWGDHGHLQPLPISYPGFAAGAELAWNVDSADEAAALPLADLLDLHVFEDKDGGTGHALVKLGETYLKTGAQAMNGSALFFALLFAHKPASERRGEGMTLETLDATRRHLRDALDDLGLAGPRSLDRRVVQRELEWVADISRLACDLVAARLENGEDEPLHLLPKARKLALSTRLAELTERHHENWQERNRPGGLDDSASRLTRIQSMLQAS